MSLSAKQLAMAWINSKLEPNKINPEEEELQALNGGQPIKEKTLEQAISTINSTLAKLKETKFQPYVDKYCNPEGAIYDDQPTDG